MTRARNLADLGSDATGLATDAELTSGLAAKANLAVKGCGLYNAADFAVAAATITLITFSAELFDTDSFHDNTTNTERVTIPAGMGGYYLVSGGVYTSGGTVSVGVLNGTTNKIYFGDSGTVASVSQVVPAAAGDWLALRAYSAAGATIYGSSSLGDYAPFLTAIYLGT